MAEAASLEFSSRTSAIHRARRLDERLARAAVAWSIRPDVDAEDVADQLLALAAGNRTALERALGRVVVPRAVPLSGRSQGAGTTTGARAAAALRLALSRGRWTW